MDLQCSILILFLLPIFDVKQLYQSAFEQDVSIFNLIIVIKNVNSNLRRGLLD